MEIFFAPRGSDVVTESMDGESVVIDLNNGAYYSLEGSGGYVWESIVNGQSIAQIEKALASAFPQKEKTLSAQIQSLVDTLIDAKLMIAIEAPQTSSSEQPALPTTCEHFSLQSYTDMKELLMLDPIHEVEEAGWPKKKEDMTEQ